MLAAPGPVSRTRFVPVAPVAALSVSTIHQRLIKQESLSECSHSLLTPVHRAFDPLKHTFLSQPVYSPQTAHARLKPSWLSLMFASSQVLTLSPLNDLFLLPEHVLKNVLFFTCVIFKWRLCTCADYSEKKVLLNNYKTNTKDRFSGSYTRSFSSSFDKASFHQVVDVSIYLVLLHSFVELIDHWTHIEICYFWKTQLISHSRWVFFLWTPVKSPEKPALVWLSLIWPNTHWPHTLSECLMFTCWHQLKD